jgi:hypothetical protein
MREQYIPADLAAHAIAIWIDDKIKRGYITPSVEQVCRPVDEERSKVFWEQSFNLDPFLVR